MNEYRKSLQNFKTSKLHKSYPKTSHLSLMLTDAENDVNKKSSKFDIPWECLDIKNIGLEPLPNF